MLNTNTAQEWVDAAIACGADPHITPGPVDRNGAPIPGEPSRWISTKEVGIDRVKRPKRYADELFDEVYAISRHIGRVRPGAEEMQS